MIPVRTRVLTAEGWLDFQEYFVHRQCQPAVREFMFAGAETARAQPDALAALERPDLRAIVICPSNPFVSVEPILARAGNSLLRSQQSARTGHRGDAHHRRQGDQGTGGQNDELNLGWTSAEQAVARRYAGLIDGFVIDHDGSASLKPARRSGSSVPQPS